MRPLRLLAVGASVAACTLVIGFVSADRLAHSRQVSAARAAPPEPSATGSVPAETKPAAAPTPAPPKIPSGFDTERLNALMRGDPILPGR